MLHCRRFPKYVIYCEMMQQIRNDDNCWNDLRWHNNGSRTLVAGVSRRSVVFIPRPVHVGIVVNEEAERQGFFWVFLFISVSVIPPMLRTHYIIYHRRHVISEIDSIAK